MPDGKILPGSELSAMTDEELENAAEKASVFAKLSPDQKTRVVAALRKKHTVGFMGDGINDAAAMKAADVGISVDTAVDIAKESADIILTEKDLNVLEQGIIEGRRTYANTMKYIKITASSNFGNMFSILAASIVLPFLPMLPVQILILNMIYDISCLALPFDRVDADYLKIPRKWDAGSISRFMFWFGPVSSVFDILTYFVMFFAVCPKVFGAYGTLDAGGKLAFTALFQAGWFVESQWTQTFVVHCLRTGKMLSSSIFGSCFYHERRGHSGKHFACRASGIRVQPAASAAGLFPVPCGGGGFVCFSRGCSQASVCPEIRESAVTFLAGRTFSRRSSHAII